MINYGKCAAISQTDLRTKLLVSMLFAVGTAACAKIYIPLWFTPIPVTLQVFAVILSGLVLGSRWGAVSQLMYLSMGMMGLPVFAGWISGPAVFAGPTGGYLIGFVFGAFAAGWVSEYLNSKTRLAYWISGVAGIVMIYLFGTMWLSVWLGITDNKSFMASIKSAWHLGAAPFAAIDLIKAIAASGMTTGLRYGNSMLRKFHDA
ncbi:MAG: biotin transporter BioY [Armatimonadota bacterium]